MRAMMLPVLALLLLALAPAQPAMAQDTSHPAAIYGGTCPLPGTALVTLWDASPSFIVDGEADAGGGVGPQSGFPVQASVTNVEMPLSDLVATEHAILVHRSEAEMDDYLVCGDIGGATLGADQLPVALGPVGLSAWTGIALLDDAGDGTTTVSLYVFEGPGIDTASDGAPFDPGLADAKDEKERAKAEHEQEKHQKELAKEQHKADEHRKAEHKADEHEMDEHEKDDGHGDDD